MRPVATDVARSVVCVSVCVLGTRVSCAKTAKPIEMLFWGQTPVRQRNNMFDGDIHIPHGWGTFEGHVPAHCNVPMDECIPHCSPAAAGECACLPHEADECIAAASGGKTAMRPLAKYFGHLFQNFAGAVTTCSLK